MTALQLVEEPQARFQFKEAAHIPKGVTVDGVLRERERIVQAYGRATAKESADAVLAAPEEFPNLRAFAPEDAETALRQAVENGIRYAYKNIVQLVVEPAPRREPRTIELRVFHAVPVEGANDLSYEPITVIRDSAVQRGFLIRELRKDAQVFSEKLENVLAEIESLI